MRPLEVMPWGQTIAYVADINSFFGGTVHAHGQNWREIRYVFNNCSRTLHERHEPI